MQRLLGVIMLLTMAVPAGAQSPPGPTLAATRARGLLHCAVSSITPGFGTIGSDGTFRGMDVDTCKAVVAAVFDDAFAREGPARVKFVALNGSQRLVALQTGEVDLTVQTVTQTMSREASSGLMFAGTTFYDGQGFLVRMSSGVTKAAELAGASVCVLAGSTSELNLADWSRTNQIDVRPVVFDGEQQARQAYDAGRCDAFTLDASQLVLIATLMHDRDNQLVLPDIISKEPLGPVVRQGDDQWYLIVKWTLNALIEAEELGITQANVAEMRTSTSLPIKRLLGVDGAFGPSLGLDKNWAYRAILAVGNYGEVFNRHFGPASGLNIARGKNELWRKGGLIYSAPIR